MITRILFSCVCFFLTLVANAQLNPAELDSKLTKAQKILGGDVVALIYKDGKIAYKKKLGEGFDEKTQVAIGGSSRWLTTALVLQFIDEGKLTLDTKVADILPIYAKYGKKFITIGHCLSDLTGIEDKKGNIVENSRFNSLEELVNDYPKKEIRANAGTDFWYGSIGINIAARVIEIIGKKGFEQLIAQKLTKPLGMKATIFSPENNKCVNPAGGALSTANDYMMFLSMILNKGMFNGKQILSANAIEELKKIQMTSNMVAYAPKDAEKLAFGLGGNILSKDADEKATTIGCPNFGALWPFVDFCNNYACIIFPKDILGDSRKDFYTSFKQTIDSQLNSICN